MWNLELRARTVLTHVLIISIIISRNVSDETDIEKKNGNFESLYFTNHESYLVA